MRNDKTEKWKGMDEIDEISNTRERKEWKTNKKGRIMRNGCKSD